MEPHSPTIPLLPSSHRFHSNKTEFQLQIKFPDDTSLTISCALNSTLQSLHERIFRERPELQGKTLKIISRGRVLTGSSQLLGVLLRDSIVDAYAQDVEGPATVIVQCSVSEVNSSNDSNQAPNQTHRGLDRLLDLGLSREEVEGLRSQFHSLRGRDLPASGTVEAQDQEHLDQLRRAEDAFLENEAQQQTSEEDYSKELLIALLFGFFGGIIAAIFAREPGWFSRRGQLGIMIGLLLNVSFGLLRLSSV